MKKFILLMLTAILMCVSIVMAAPTITLNAPGNNTYDTDGDLVFNYTAVGNVSTWTCNLNTDDTGTWAERETDSGVINDTSTLFTRNSISDRKVKWNINCTDPNNAGNKLNSGFYYVTVDTISPVIDVVAPKDNSWSTDGYVQWQINVTDNNADSCVLWTNLNATTNSTGSYVAKETVSYTNDTVFEYAFGNVTNKWHDNGTSDYIWNVVCNDSAGNSNTLTSNYTLLVDATSPGAFKFLTSDWQTSGGLSLYNASTSTDYTPQIGWEYSVEANFDRYRIRFYNTTLGTGGFVEKNSSTQGSASANLTTDMSTLVGDKDYFIWITAYDLAGNSVNTTISDYRYSTISQGRTLGSGWNVHMIQGNTLSLGQLLNSTGASTVSYYNSSHQFTSHISGGSNSGTSVPYGEAYFAYMGSASTMSDMVRNTTSKVGSFNITNQTSGAYSLACNRNLTTGYSFQKLDYYFNGDGSSVVSQNVSRFSFFNSSAATNYKYIPFLYNWTFNNETIMNYGDCSFFELNEAVQTKGWLEIDWLSI